MEYGQFSKDLLYFPTGRKRCKLLEYNCMTDIYSANEFATKNEKKLVKTKL